MNKPRECLHSLGLFSKMYKYVMHRTHIWAAVAKEFKKKR